ncbi:Plasmid replication region DNA-binding N-term [Rhodanobacter denitrificans]|uniref:Plasmid replication region DNA-binding N-term n=2 Tax=Rhodanobacter denitrificans TaxID=666685 RepID=M4NEG2_9GAMM|nr:Plasmid replication region DNA-binding N-term [Rhodanobacter denitrificans]AGG89205.1 Plasmid replication region DNA-binding N-term [Rhodanobacter denitrificans]
MARGGLYKTEVQKARNSLLAQGKHPSVDALRVALGNTGSKTTIHRYLKELEAEDGPRVGATVAISDALQDLVGRLAERLHEEAEVRITAAQERFTAERQALTATVEQHRQEATALSTQLQRTDIALQDEKAAHEQAQQGLRDRALLVQQLEERVAGMTTRLTEHEAHIQSLEDKHQHARDALEHYRTAVKEQRDQEQRRHEHQVQGLQVELRQANDTITSKNHELLQLNRDNARMTEHINQLDKEFRQFRTEHQKLQHAYDANLPLAKEHPTLQMRLAQAEQGQAHLQTQLAAAETQLTTERDHRREVETQRAASQARLDVLEEMFARLRNVSTTEVDVHEAEAVPRANPARSNVRRR